MSCLCEASLSKYDLFRSRSVSQEVWPELATAKTELSHRHCTASAAPSVPPNLYSKLKRWKFVDTKCHSVKLKTLFMIGGHCGQVAGGRGPPPPLTASHDLDSASAMLHSNGHLLLVLLDWTYPLSTTRHHHADGWSFQCATSRHYLVNCSCTVGLCKNGQFRSH